MSDAPLAGLYEAYHAEQQAAQKRLAEAIVAAITNGSTRHQVANEIGVTYDAVVRILKRAGLTAPLAKRGPKGGMRLHSERNQADRRRLSRAIPPVHGNYRAPMGDKRRNGPADIG